MTLFILNHSEQTQAHTVLIFIASDWDVISLAVPDLKSINTGTDKYSIRFV